MRRNCLFQDENEVLRLHKNYSQANCFLECRLAYAQDLLKRQMNTTYLCTPWFFPFKDEGHVLCDPWESVEILNIMLDDIPDSACKDCLPGICLSSIFIFFFLSFFFFSFFLSLFLCFFVSCFFLFLYTTCQVLSNRTSLKFKCNLWFYLLL